MTRSWAQTGFTLVLAATLLGYLSMAWRLQSASRLAPLLLAGGTLALVGWQLLRDLRPAPAGEAPAKASKRSSKPIDAIGFIWALALPPAIYLLGCLTGMALHTLLLVRFRGGRSWTLAAALAALTALPVFGLAQLMARRELLSGALWAWLQR